MYRKPYRIKKKKSLLKNRYFWRMVLGLIFAGEIFYVVYFFSYFQIKEIEITGNEKVRSEAIKNFIPPNSIFLVDSQKITDNILKIFPAIAEVKIDRRFPDKLTLHVKERQAAVIFCVAEKCFLIDEGGIVFESVSVKLSLTEIMGENFGEAKLGEKIIDENLLSQILKISLKFESDFSEKVNTVTVVSEDRLNIKTAEGWQAYFNPQKDIDWQITKLQALFGKEIPVEKRKNLDYVELRFSNLAPYKYR